MIILFSLVILFLCQIFFKPDIKFKVSKIVFYLSIFLVLIYSLYLGFNQYDAWNSNEITIYFLPPHKSIFYLINYIFIRFTLYYLISLIIAVFFLNIVKYFNKKKGFQFFEPDEIYFASTAIFLLGNPNWRYVWLWYFPALLGVYLIWHLLHKLEIGNWKLEIREARLPLYYLWLPVGILVILIEIMSNF